MAGQDNLTGQVAIVTGASRGLGRAFAVSLGQAGVAVAVTGRTADDVNETVRLVAQTGAKSLAFVTDAADPAGAAHVVAQTEAELGPVDILINNAGAAPTEIAPWLADPDEWWRVIETNVRGTFLYTRTVLPGMVERKRGRIVNIVSEAGNNPEPDLSAYSTSKAALIHFTEAMATAAADEGVRVFAYHPGMVRTGLADHLVSNDGGAMGQRLKAAFAEGRDTPVERSAERLMFLASGRGDFLTGRYIMARQTEEDLLAQASDIATTDLYKLRVNRVV
jgi:NAD(P)-dependent dehydrogenase (short-subunit alcohol dehydrogenase family)